jgi:acetylornithine deacetylase/succinyl-diaminopimelate desuccinylase-like protein
MGLPEALWNDLERTIARRTIAGNVNDNCSEVTELVERLKVMGFEVTMTAQGRHGQPALVAYRPASVQGRGTIAMYNHYDVEPVHGRPWSSNPWVLTERDGRLYGRGVGDNKGVLYARLHVVRKMVEAGESMSGLLWLIQGEEEVGPELAYAPFKEAIAAYSPALFLEETGYHRSGRPMVLIKGPMPPTELIEAAVGKDHVVEQRTLNKAYQQNPCPFISGIPSTGSYIAFGPNDEHSRIHRSDESISAELLDKYLNSFGSFLRAVNTTVLTYAKSGPG